MPFHVRTNPLAAEPSIAEPHLDKMIERVIDAMASDEGRVDLSEVHGPVLICQDLPRCKR